MADKQRLLHEAKISYIKYCESHQSWQKATKHFAGARKIEFRMDQMKAACESLEKSVRNLLILASDYSAETKRFKIMLAYALTCKLECMTEDRLPYKDCYQLFEEIINLLEPYKSDAMIITPKLVALTIIYTSPLESDLTYYKVQQHQVETVSAVHANVNNKDENWQVWNGAEVFGVPFDEQSLAFLKYQDKRHMSNVFNRQDNTYENVIDKTMKKSTDDLKAMPAYDIIAKKLKSENPIYQVEALKMINARIDTLLNLGYFKQAHHILSVGFYYSVKIRRKMLPEQRSAMNMIQGELSGNFALYALMLFTGMTSEMDGGVLKRNDDFVELTEAIEEGLEVYSSQFPVEYPTSPKEVEKLSKRAILWIDQAMALCKEWPAKLKEFESSKAMIIHMKNSRNFYF